MSVTLTSNSDAKWTKALKLMLADLKLCLKWMTDMQDAGDKHNIGHMQQPTNPAE
jgi:hypothetical protein